MRQLIYRNSKGREIVLSNSRPFILETFEQSSSSTSNFIVSPRDNGICIDDISIKEKPLVVTAGIKGEDKSDLERKRLLITSILNPLLSGELIYTNRTITRKIKVNIENISFQNPLGTIQKFMIQFIAPIPFWSDINTIKTDIAIWEGLFEFPLEVDFDEGTELGRRVSNLICNIKNSGDVPCGMRIQFRALATIKNPSLFNLNTREYIKVNKTLNINDVLEINTEFANKRIELVRSNGTRENVYHWLDLDSDFIQLDIGDNLFRYEADSGIDNLEVSIYHNNLYLGV